MWLRVGDKNFAIKFDERQMEPDRMSSVQFVRIKLKGIDSENLLKLANENRVSILIDHPNLAAEAPITGVIATALAEDLRPEQA